MQGEDLDAVQVVRGADIIHSMMIAGGRRLRTAPWRTDGASGEGGEVEIEEEHLHICSRHAYIY